MSVNDPLAEVLSHVLAYEKQGRNEITVGHNSKIVVAVLKIMQDKGYLGSYEIILNTVKINLLGKINKCGVIKPRYNVKTTDYRKFEHRYLPALDFGVLIVSTSKGLMTQEDALKIGEGGKLLAFVY